MINRIFKRKDTVEEVECSVDSKDRVLYILTEKSAESLQSYMDTLGITVKNVYSNIEDVKIAMLVESRPLKLIVIEYGIGRFTHAIAKGELYDLLGICDTGDKTITIYYTKSTLRSDYKNGHNNKVTWKKYNNTGSIIDNILDSGTVCTNKDDTDTKKVGLSTGAILDKLSFVGEQAESEV